MTSYAINEVLHSFTLIRNWYISSKVLPVIFLLEWMSILFVFKVLNFKPFLWSHRFARLRQVWSED